MSLRKNYNQALGSHPNTLTLPLPRTYSLCTALYIVDSDNSCHSRISNVFNPLVLSKRPGQRSRPSSDSISECITSKSFLTELFVDDGDDISGE
jgi:hypothetical protein